MFVLKREVVNGLDGIQLNITERGIVKTFPTRKDAQNYLLKLQREINCNRFSLRGVCKNEFRAEHKGENLHYFRFFITEKK